MDTNKRIFTLDLRIVIVLLLAVIAVLLFMWRPWDGTGTSDRTVEVTGDAKITAVPDEFAFHPSWQFTNDNKEVALAALSAKSDEVIKKLKELGVADNNIKSNANGYDQYGYMERSGSSIYTLQLTITLANKELAQKVQDYLVTTSPTGSVTPQPAFSDAKRKELENKAREQATKDARNKADQMGKNLGFKLGKVKSIDDGSGFDVVRPFEGGATLEADNKAAPQLQVQPGENDLPYSVTVVYFIR